MKKIMFNDIFGLTEAVLSGRKTQTRRIVKGAHAGEIQTVDIINGVVHLVKNDYNESCNDDFDEYDDDGHIHLKIPYKVGEVVAVAQSYKDAGCDKLLTTIDVRNSYRLIKFGETAGWTNKMFVRADLMPHHIRITGVRVERLQDISDEDCIKEGIICKWHAPACRNYYYVPNEIINHTDKVHETTQEAYAALIDKISGKGTWDSNPWVFVYDFELVD